VAWCGCELSSFSLLLSRQPRDVLPLCAHLGLVHVQHFEVITQVTTGYTITR
jgi:hypothetical protein